MAKNHYLADSLKKASEVAVTAQKMNFLLRISSVNVTNSAVSCEFGLIYWRNP